MQPTPSGQPSPFAARTRAASPSPAPAPSPSDASSSRAPFFAGLAALALLGVGLVAWLALRASPATDSPNPAATASSPPAAPASSQAAAPASPPAPAPSATPAPAAPSPAPILAPADPRADYALLARLASAHPPAEADRPALAAAALLAADGAHASAVERLAPAVARAVDAAYAERSTVLRGLKLEDHHAPAVDRLRESLALADEASARSLWIEAARHRAAALERLPEARDAIATRLASAAKEASARRDLALATYFYEQTLRLAPGHAAARAHLHAHKFAPGQIIAGPGDLRFAYVPPGEFLRGSRPAEPGREPDETPARVRLTAGFFLGVTEITQRQWDQVFGPGAAARVIAAAPARSSAIASDLPMHSLRWDEAAEFCRRLGRIDGRVYRLPTEAEWEYACRAGSASAFNTGADALSIREANIDDGSASAPFAPVVPGAVGAPNFWGLRDMHGNVWEWCADWSAPYPAGDALDPRGPSDAQIGRADLAMRVVRGGGWNAPASAARSANRWEYSPSAATGYIGLRVVMEPVLAEP